MTFKVYLAGAISGLTYDQGQDWRVQVKEALAPEIACYSPLRAKDYLRSAGVLEQFYESTPLSTDRGIMTRDYNDCITSDLIFVNLLGATPRVSIGTMMELGFAYAHRKPVVMVIEDDRKNIHDYPMVREAVGFRFNNIEGAIWATRAILLADPGAIRPHPHINPPPAAEVRAPSNAPAFDQMLAREIEREKAAARGAVGTTLLEDFEEREERERRSYTR
jgi:nucleoside 2-deoxyribosyltransferase